jgi:RTX calcium-binding nonapeptide repeat (4 copies)
MGQVVPFIARVRDSGDWSAAERARLEDLAERLAASGVRVEVIFGATDEGDPWCVVTDADGDVLIHVARIDGKFVVHSAVDDAVNESADLHTALRDRLDATEEAMAPQSATILPFGLTARQGQTFLALLAAATFFYETAAIGDTAEAGEKIQALPPPNDDPPPGADAPAQEREATQGVALQPAATPSTPQLAPTPAAAAVAEPEPPAPPPAIEAQAPAPAAKSEALAAPPADDARIVIQGTAGDDLLVGTRADEHILGGDGNDTLRGGGGNDVLEGGAGDDVIELTGQVTAVGGEGADTFVLATPVQAGPERLLGVILDFSGFEGDRIFNLAGEAVRFRPPPTTDGGTDHKGPPDDGDGGFTTTLVPPHPGPDTLAPPTGGGDFTTTVVVGPPLTRVEVDLNGDGVVDGYILVGIRGPIVTTVGASLGPSDPII